MYIESEFMLLEANNERLARENEKLTEVLMKEVIELANMAMMVDEKQTNELMTAVYSALGIEEECTCLPDLPDGRGRGHCPVCEAKPKENPVWR